MPTCIARILFALTFMLAMAAPAVAEIVSVPFPIGIIGTIGQNTGKLNDVRNFETLGIVTGHFRQVSENGRFGGTQGNDLSGTLRLVFDGGTFADISGAINWRITTQGEVEYFGFIPEPGYSTTLPGGHVLDDSSNYAVGKLGTTLHYADGTDVSGNAALSGLVDDLNLYLDETSQGAPVIVGPSGVPGSSSETRIIPEGTSLVWDFEGGSLVTWQTFGGDDEALFTIDPVSGVLSFIVSPIFDSPQDQGRDNVYEVVIMATDQNGLTATQTLTVRVTEIPNVSPAIGVHKTMHPVKPVDEGGDCETGGVDDGAVFYQSDLCIEYQIEVQSEANGSEPALNVIIRDDLPEDISFVAMTEATGFDTVSVDQGELLATIVVLEAGKSARLRFRARVR